MQGSACQGRLQGSNHTQRGFQRRWSGEHGGTREASQRKWDWSPAGWSWVRQAGPVSTKGTDQQGLAVAWGGEWHSSHSIETYLFCVLINQGFALGSEDLGEGGSLSPAAAR